MAGAQPKPDDHAALLAELQHRVRNTLAAMRALVRQSAETSESLEEYVRHLDGRLDAMARVQNAVIRNPAIGIDLGMLIADELAVCDAHEGERLSIEGPRLLLHPRAAEPIGLALHELATNALKFGALASPSGRIAVYWRFEDREARAQHLLFEWIETGVVMDDATPRQGFGRRILEEMLAHQLSARTALAFTPHGVSYRIDLPLTERVVQEG